LHIKENIELSGYNGSAALLHTRLLGDSIVLNMKDKSFSERLNIALDKEGFPQKNRGRIQLLAEMVGLSHRGASKWVNGETCPPAKKYFDLAKKLNVREEWLRTGQGQMTDEPADAGTFSYPSSSLTSVPVYHTENFFSSDKKPIKHVSCDLPAKGELFAIMLETEAMSPRFPVKSVIIFDTQKKFEDGDFVLVNFDNYPAPIFRQLLIIGSSMYLNAHNPKFDRLPLSEPHKILGVMVQAIVSFI
jgi:SOS-response transcriptional repressor LexA